MGLAAANAVAGVSSLAEVRLLALGPRFHLDADIPLDDLAGEAATSEEDGAQLHLPGLARSPRSHLSGTRKLYGAERESLELLRFGFHSELRPPPNMGYPPDDGGDGRTTDSSGGSGSSGSGEVGSGEAGSGSGDNGHLEVTGSGGDGGDSGDGDNDDGGVDAGWYQAQARHYAAQQRIWKLGDSYERADCKWWCEPGVHCSLTHDADGEAGRASRNEASLDLRDDCRGCEPCVRPQLVPSELRRRLAGYAMKGGSEGAASQQALAPFVLAMHGYYYLFVSWYAPLNTSRIMYGRSMNGPLGPFVDQQGGRMDVSLPANLSASSYTFEQGVRHTGLAIPVDEWRPAGGAEHEHVLMSVRCGPDEPLGDATHQPNPWPEA